MISPDETLGSLATAHPAATAVFLRHRLNFCCGGARRLAEACGALGLDPTVVIAEIAAEGTSEPPKRWDTRPLPELIDFIVRHYHDPLRLELPALIDAAQRVEHVHGAEPSCPRGLAAHLQQLTADITQHLAKEEQVLFPALRSGARGQQIHMPVRVLMQEHVDHGASLKRTRELSADFVLPAEACSTWRALYVALERLEADLMNHIHLENHVLFPRVLGD